MLLKERPAHVAVQTEGEVVVDVGYALLQVLRFLCIVDAPEKYVDEPLQ